jgi:signal transduction histidine kinase
VAPTRAAIPRSFGWLTDLDQRTDELLRERQATIHRRTDRLFGALLVGQWLLGIVIALAVSPYVWRGVGHHHVRVAIGLGGAITFPPLLLIATRPGRPVTRMVVAAAQMLWSALLIHLTGGRIETHFHVFASLAFLALYRDWRVLVPATLVVVADLVIRQIVWPESVFGIVHPEWWRCVEHATWVVCEDVVLVMACVASTREMRAMARNRAEAEDGSRALDAALDELQATQATVVRAEKLAAVGQLAAGVGHELRNPLAAVRNASSFLAKRLKDEPDEKIQQFLALIDRELGACTKIISDLLDFARDREPALAPCPLRPLVDEAVTLVPASAVTIANEVPEELPVPSLDKDQFRQVIVNLVQNAVEALESCKSARVVVAAKGGGKAPLVVEIRDNGPGIPEKTLQRIFEPLFTTKTKGTGLGLAIVDGVVKRHGGVLRVDSKVGTGTTFSIELPASAEVA